MKKLIYITLMAAAFLTSCDMKEDYVVDKSAAVDYAGDWYYGIYNSDMSSQYTSYADLHGEDRMITFNTAANLANEIWIDDKDVFLGIKFKSVFTGDTKSFKSTAMPNQYYSSAVVQPKAASALNVTETKDQSYKEVEVLEGKILEGAGKSKTGNPADSIYLKLKIYLDRFTFKSELDKYDTTFTYKYDTTSFEWNLDTIEHKIDKDNPHYDEDWVAINDTVYWEVDTLGKHKFVIDTTSSFTPADIDTVYKWIKQTNEEVVTEEYVISGHRHTGFIEDDY